MALFNELKRRNVFSHEGGLELSRQGPLLNPLHEDPRWQAYLERLGISDAHLANIKLEVKLPE